jgi:DNA polymerase-3 subunit delta
VPTLDAAALKKRIASRTLEPLHVLWGEDVKRLDAAVEDIVATVDPADQPFAVERFHAGEEGAAPLDIAAAARVYPMLGDRRIVIVLRAEKFLKPKRSAKAEEETGPSESESSAEGTGDDLRPLEDYVKAPSAFTTLVFVASGLDRGRRFTKQVVERALVTEFAGLATDGKLFWQEAMARARAHVERAMVESGRAIDPGAARLLAERSGGEISRLRGDLERLLLYTEGQARIGEDDVREIVTTQESVTDDWGLVNALEAGNVAKALRDLTLRFDRGDSPHAIVGQLRWWVSSKLVQIDPRRVPSALDALLRTDLALKSSGGDEQMLVERLVVELGAR